MRSAARWTRWWPLTTGGSPATGTRAAGPTGRVDPRVVAAAAAVIDAQTHASTGTKSRAVRQIRRLVEDEHGPGTVPVPSDATLYRLLDALSAGRHTFGSAVTRRQAANRPDGAFTSMTAARPGEQVLMDGTPLDVMAVMDDGVPGRPELVAAIDIGTRTLCAAVLRPVGAKAVDAAVLLARMMVPEPMRPGWDQALAMSASRIPCRRLATIDERIEMAAAKPVIIPDTVVIDHGRVFLSEVFLRAADTLGISVQPAHQLTPTDKPRVAYCTSSERLAARWRSCRLLGVVPASLVEGRRVGSGRVVKDFAFVVIPLPADNSGVVPDLDGGGGHGELRGYLL
jgi:hypothetical protein